MIDPTDALNSLQDALKAKAVQMQPCTLYTNVNVLLDQPDGKTSRFTYAQIEDDKVKAIALIVQADFIERIPCFQVGYAVEAGSRNRGLGFTILQQALDEFRHGMSRTPLKEFYAEAIVSKDNIASHRIASKLISDTPETVHDEISNEPALQYLTKVKLS